MKRVGGVPRPTGGGPWAFGSARGAAAAGRATSSHREFIVVAASRPSLDASEWRFRGSDLPAARQLVRRAFARDPGGLRRAVAAASATSAEAARWLSDDEVVERVASLIAQRKLRLYEAQRPLRVWDEMPEEEEKAAPWQPEKDMAINAGIDTTDAPLVEPALAAGEPPLFAPSLAHDPPPLFVPRLDVSSVANDVEPDAGLESLDAAAQAASLRDAAATGAPFCEECEKARLAAQAEAQLSDPELSSAMDAPAQAATMRKAAAAGTPFCEECEKAKEAASHGA